MKMSGEAIAVLLTLDAVILSKSYLMYLETVV